VRASGDLRDQSDSFERKIADREAAATPVAPKHRIPFFRTVAR